MKKFFSSIFLFAFLAACGTNPTAPAPASTFTPIAAQTSAPVVVASTPLPEVTREPSPTPALTTRVSPNDGMVQVYVPKGEFIMGGLDVYADEDEKPAHKVTLDAFWVDQVEVTNEMYARCMMSGACPAAHNPVSSTRLDYFYNPAYKDYPVINVYWGDARAYCEWMGRRLLTEAEWERAARGDDMRTYPWGEDTPSAAFVNFNDIIKDTSRVGSYAAGASPFGALDMAGNVWEWTSDFYDKNYYKLEMDFNPTGPASVSKLLRVIRGGSYQDSLVDLRLSNRGSELGPNPTVKPDDPALIGNASVKIGFRCASDP